MGKKIFIGFLLILYSLTIGYAQRGAKYGYPFDSITHKIAYSNIESVEVSKAVLWKRSNQYIAIQNFDRETEVPLKVGGYYHGTVIDKSILYQDQEDGKLLGNGFINFVYEKHKYFVLTFTYKIYIKENQYRYVFTDFVIKEFIHLGKSKTANTLSYTKGTTKTGGMDIRSYPLETFIERVDYDKSDQFFKDEVSRLIKELKQTMLGNL